MCTGHMLNMPTGHILPEILKTKLSLWVGTRYPADQSFFHIYPHSYLGTYWILQDFCKEAAELWMDFSAGICSLILGASAGTPVLFPKHEYTGKLGLPKLSESPDLTSSEHRFYISLTLLKDLFFFR